MRYILILILLFSSSYSKNIKKESWYKLEKEVNIKKFSQNFIDSLKDSLNVISVQNAHSIKIKTPQYDKCVYEISWGNINAGFGYIENNRNKDTLNILGKAVTNSFVSAFYKVRDYVHTSAHSKGLYPYFFEEGLAEKDYRRHKWTLYDYGNKKIYKKDTPTSETKSFNMTGTHTTNYLTLLYYLRNIKLTVGDTVSIPIFVHNKDWHVKTIVLKKETIKVNGKKYRTIKVQPIMVGNGHGFNSKDNMYIWLTDDSRRLPVFFKAKARLGNIRAKLVYSETK